MCSRWKWQSETSAKDVLTSSRLLSLFEELELMGTTLVLFSGGEPLLREDLFDIIKFAHKRGMKTGIFTNGTLIDQKKAEMITHLGTDTCISVDGSKAALHDEIRGVKGSFQKAVEGITLLVEAKKSAPPGKFTSIIGMNAVIQEGNLDDLADYYLLGKTLGVDFVRYNLVHGDSAVTLGENPRTRLKKSLEELHRVKGDLTVFECPFVKGVADGTIDVDHAQKGLPALSLMEKTPTPCFKSSCYALIDAFGRVFPCTHTYFDNQSYRPYEEKRTPYYLGNIGEASFYTVWNSSQYTEFRRTMNPVNVAAHRETCGQCEQVFEFRKLQEILTRLKNGDQDLPSPDRVKYEFETLW
jgi:radical SAM protein with 4Fe4S-binding SPASM domain